MQLWLKSLNNDFPDDLQGSTQGGLQDGFQDGPPGGRVDAALLYNYFSGKGFTRYLRRNRFAPGVLPQTIFRIVEAAQDGPRRPQDRPPKGFHTGLHCPKMVPRWQDGDEGRNFG